MGAGSLAEELSVDGNIYYFYALWVFIILFWALPSWLWRGAYAYFEIYNDGIVIRCPRAEPIELPWKDIGSIVIENYGKSTRYTGSIEQLRFIQRVDTLTDRQRKNLYRIGKNLHHHRFAYSPEAARELLRVCPDLITAGLRKAIERDTVRS
ncbi:MAG: hypothetical protein FWE69_02495 [Clostridiales bacterium]|nr:hypothetical protein [Clostridiales bacterium]